MDALDRDLRKRLHEQGVSMVPVGDTTGVLDSRWLVEVNSKTHYDWSLR